MTLSERIPIDRNGDPRFRNDAGMPDTGNTDFENWLVDMGAYEFQPPACPGDTDGDGTVGILDFLTVLGTWGACP